MPRAFKIEELLLARMHPVLEHRSFSELSIRLLEQSLPAPRSGQGIQRQPVFASRSLLDLEGPVEHTGRNFKRTSFYFGHCFNSRSRPM